MRVLELGEHVGAAYCGKSLARWGAEVIKVEPPEGDLARGFGPFKDGQPHAETSALYLYLNGGKKSITLNLEGSAGTALFDGLADRCDVVICNLGRGVVEGLNLSDYARRHPEKVVVSITPFGLTGPYSHFEGTVGVALAMGGYMHIMGDPDREPLSMPGWYPDYQAGAYAGVGILAAWLGRDTHPAGSILDVSTMEVICSLHQYTTVQYTHGGVVRKRRGNRFDGLYPVTMLPCKDGWLGMCINNVGFWERFCLMVGRPELVDDPRLQSPSQRYLYADEVDELIGPALRERSAAELFAEGQEVWRLPVGSVMGISELLGDRHLEERGFWQEVEHPEAGSLRYPSAPFLLDGSRFAERRAPLLGEHNQEVYGTLLGLSQEEQARLRQMGAI